MSGARDKGSPWPLLLFGAMLIALGAWLLWKWESHPFSGDAMANRRTSTNDHTRFADLVHLGSIGLIGFGVVVFATGATALVTGK